MTEAASIKIDSSYKVEEEEEEAHLVLESGRTPAITALPRLSLDPDFLSLNSPLLEPAGEPTERVS